MAIVISVLIIIASILLILIVLVQNSKGGGLASNFSGSNQIMGVKKTTDFLEKATWILAIALVVLCIASSAVNEKNVEVAAESVMQEEISTEQVQIPAGAATAPEAQE